MASHIVAQLLMGASAKLGGNIPQGLGWAGVRGFGVGLTSVFRSDPLADLYGAAGGVGKLGQAGRAFHDQIHEARFGLGTLPKANTNMTAFERDRAHARQLRAQARARRLRDQGKEMLALPGPAPTRIPTALPEVGAHRQIAAATGAGLGLMVQYGLGQSMLGMNLIHFGGMHAGHFYGTGGWAGRPGGPRGKGFVGRAAHYANPVPKISALGHSAAGLGATAAIGGITGIF